MIYMTEAHSISAQLMVRKTDGRICELAEFEKLEDLEVPGQSGKTRKQIQGR